MSVREKHRKGEFISPLTYYQQVLLATLCLISLLLRSGSCFESALVSSAEKGGEDRSTETVVTDHITEACLANCPDENRTNSEHLNVGCGKDCYVKQCNWGCKLWEQALETSCQIVCNRSSDENMEPKEMYCVMGCNDAQSRYFRWLRTEVGIPRAPALVPDTLNATSLTLEWEIPPKLIDLTLGRSFVPKSYLVQWRYEEVDGDWKFCRNQSMGRNSTVRVDNLQPYTRYRFRVALPLSRKEDEVLISEQSVIITTLPQGPPKSKPLIVRAVAVDHTTISVSWEPGPFPNGPILSYSLRIKDLSLTGEDGVFKDIPVTENTVNSYMFSKLLPFRNYSIYVSMLNAEGEGPAAETTLSTPNEPTVKDNEPEPTLILGSEYSILSQGADILSEPQKVFYRSEHRIVGVAIHVAKQLVFVAEENGYVFRAVIDGVGSKEAILSPQSDQNFKPVGLSLDWLNDHVYILGEVNHREISYQISRCDLDGRGLTTAIAGLQKKPNHIQVDPYNGYLFWIISGYHSDTGLFRLDLRDISNGVKHNVTPDKLIEGNNLGAFVVDYAKFRVLVPLQDNNTVIAVNLDGYDKEDIRNNTQSPKLNVVKSLAMANGIFYWTNGSDLFMEDHHAEENYYYHNAYPGLSNGTFVAVCVNLPSVQPVPVPVNPPRHLQALLSADKAKISWRSPHLLGIQGKGAWQEWSYALEILENNSLLVSRTNEIKGTFFTVDKLKPNTNYTFRAAAYTSAGRGPWSTEFYAKTLKSSHDRYLIWSSKDGLLQSDVLGEHIHPLIPRSKLGDHEITDMAWYDDVLYFVSNSTLRYYNRTSGLLARFLELESVESIGIDWIGKRIYWSNPTLQSIARATLNGRDQETLPTIAVARELKIDSLHGHIYYSSGNMVEVCQLHGKGRRVYFKIRPFTGKQVMGLTLDLDNERIFWIVRSFERSSLFSAPMANNFISDLDVIETTLEERSLNGPLTHFSGRLLWLQDDHTVIVGDTSGKNLARIKNTRLNGLRSVSVIDPTHHVYPNVSKELNVIPEQIKNESIRIIGNWTAFDIVWDPVETVTYGDVFYELKIHSDQLGEVDTKKELNTSLYHYTKHNLAPYSPLEITIRAFTYWGSCKNTIVKLFSPAAAPSMPTKTRVFVNHLYWPLQNGLNITATVRWNPPLNPNGPLDRYFYFYCSSSGERYDDQNCKESGTDSSKELQAVIANLSKNENYLFQVRATTEVGSSAKTHPFYIKTTQENPLPLILVATSESILEYDMDLNVSSIKIRTGSPAKFLAHIQHEELIFWVNENLELMSYNGLKKVRSKLVTMSGEVLALAIDWIQRIIYWSELEQDGSSSIYQLDLNRNEELHTPVKVLSRKAIIKDLIVLPMNHTLFWLELPNVDSNMGEIVKYNSNTKSEEDFDLIKSDCLNSTFQRIILDTASFSEDKLILVNNNGKLFQYGLISESCVLLKVRYDNTTELIVKDSGHIYLLRNQSISMYNYKQVLQLSIYVPKVYQMLAYYHQSYPKVECLIPADEASTIDYIPELVQKSNQSFLLKLPELESQCVSVKLPGVRYVVTYSELGNVNLNDCDPSLCKVMISYDSLTRIEHLKPYTKYQVKVRVNNYYAEQKKLAAKEGQVAIFSTAPGSPSPPRNITAEPISPTEAIVQWLPPLQFNSDSVSYEVHWRTENPITRVHNRQQRLVTSEENTANNSTDLISINLTKLLPSQTYSIWIQAYSTPETFSSSPVVQIDTFSEPGNITVEESGPYSLKLRWKGNRNITRYVMECTTLANTDYQIIVDSNFDERPEFEREIFIVQNLEPKTSYKFFFRLYYAKRDIAYFWPTDNRFTFETQGHVPSAPGKPKIHHVSGDVYKVTWDPSKENGAPIELYSLEALITRISNRVVRSAKEYEDYEKPAVPLLEPSAFANFSPTVLQSDIPSVDEPEAFEEKWVVYYNGTDTYWIVKDLQPINFYIFRVKSKNSYGWGPYSAISEQVSEYVSPKRRDSLLAAIFAPVVIVGSCIVLLSCVIFFFKHRSANKKIANGTTSALSDVELANLRELPRGGNFIHTTNILYMPGPLTDADVALLPQIRRDQITMSNLLGSGAFGEVYEGCVKNVNNVVETKVAIKTLRKGASEQEKGEFLQEAQLMSNFKHEHILRLIGVCFDADSLYIIMELMQGGDLLSYLRQSRPTLEIPSSLTLLDLISMCVDVASGCKYLEEMHFVHRDLACRNCLVSSVDPQYRVVKIGDFGLARDIYKNDYYRKEGEGLLPVRWMSPESLVDGVFTSQSDIWAFGVLCWEIMTLGQRPYPARNNIEVLQYVRDGGRLDRPADCPDELYQLMLECWSYSPDKRPAFSYCLEVLQCLQDHTSDNIQIMMANSNRIASGTLKFINREVNEPPTIITPASSTTSTVIPKYLELLYEENDDQRSINIIGDGYEVPISGLEKERTFSNSSTVSRSSSPNLVSSLGKFNSMNAILSVALPPDGEDRPINKSSTLGKESRNLIANDAKPFYSNTQLDSRKNELSRTAM
ncbi:protein sevenless isoform X2 [Hermetia illucens]|uniref:protein sevenless isoform X2 n=1 Tax=Hermetia illucens TaxID=343691 RepID=UPI0018CC5CDB|nr:protein sevenless isoform X2 [Hermetia illucens]